MNKETTDLLQLENLNHRENLSELPSFAKLAEETFAELSFVPDSSIQDIAPSVTFLLKNAKTLLEAKETTAAKAIFYSLLKRGELSASTYAGIATCFETEGSLERAMDYYQEALKYEFSSSIFFAISDLYLRKHDYKSALQTLVPLLQSKEVKEKDLFTLYKNLGNIYFRLKSWEEAKVSYYRAKEIDPHSDSLYSNMACLALNRGKIEESAMFFRKSLQINSHNHNAITGLGLICLLRSKKEKALDYFIYAFKKEKKNNLALFYMVKCAYELHSSSKVLPLLVEYVKENPSNKTILYSLAGLLYKEGNYGRAEKLCRQLLSFSPEHEGAKKLLQLIFHSTATFQSKE